MKRRTFLGSILAALGIGAVAPKALAETKRVSRLSGAVKFEWTEGVEVPRCICFMNRILVYDRGRLTGRLEATSNAWNCPEHGPDETRTEDGVTGWYRRDVMVAYSSEDGRYTILDPWLKAHG